MELVLGDVADVLDGFHLLLQLLTVHPIPDRLVEAGEAARHRIDPKHAPTQAILNHLPGDQLLAVCLEHHFHLMAELANELLELALKVGKLRAKARDRGRGATQTEIQLGREPQPFQNVGSRVRLDLKQVFTKLLRAVGKDEAVHDFVSAFDDGVDAAVAP